MDMETWPCRQPEAHLGVLVRGVVVDDQMDVEGLWHSLIDALEKAKELLMAVAWLAPRDHGAFQNIERRE